MTQHIAEKLIWDSCGGGGAKIAGLCIGASEGHLFGGFDLHPCFQVYEDEDGNIVGGDRHGWRTLWRGDVVECDASKAHVYGVVLGMRGSQKSKVVVLRDTTSLKFFTSRLLARWSAPITKAITTLSYTSRQVEPLGSCSEEERH